MSQFLIKLPETVATTMRLPLSSSNSAKKDCIGEFVDLGVMVLLGVRGPR